MKKMFLPFLIIMGMAVGCADDKSDAEYVSAAQSYLQQDNLQAAVIELKNALGSNPRNGEARRLLGEVYYRAGDWESAEKELLQAEGLGIPRSETLSLRARSLLELQRYDDVLSLFSDGLGELPPAQMADLVTSQGMAYLGMADTRRARATFESVLQENPDFVYARYGMARVAFSEGNTELARTLADEVLLLDETHGPTWRMLGLLQQSAGNLDAAIPAFSESIRYNANNTYDHFYRALAFIELGELDKAEADINSIGDSAPESFEFHYARGVLRFLRTDFDGAQEDLEKVAGGSTPYPPALYYSGATDIGLGRLQLAETKLRRYLADIPDNPSASRMLGQLLYLKQDYSAAEALLRQTLDAEPDNIQALELLALVMMSQPDRKLEGIGILKQLEQLQPDAFEAKINLADGLANVGQYTEALAWLELARELEPEEPDAVVREVKAYLALGDSESALSAAQTYAESYAGKPIAHTILGSVYESLGNSTAAKQAFWVTLDQEPGNISANNGMAALAITEGDLDGAIEYYNTALADHPADYKTLMNLAAVEKQLGNDAGLISALRRATTAAPTELGPRLKLAEALLATGQYSDVSDALGNIAELNPDNARLLLVQARTALLQERFTDAVTYLRKLQNVAGDSGLTYHMLAQAYDAMGDRERYMEALKSAAAAEPPMVQARLTLAEYYYAQGRLEESSELVDSILFLPFESPSLYRLTGQLAAAKGEFARASRAFEQMFRLQRTNFNLILLSGAYWESGERDKAITAFEDWLQEYPDDPLVLVELAGRYMTSGQHDRAVAGYRRVLDVSPDNALALNNLAVLLKDADNTAALGYARRALEAAPNNATVLDTTASVLLASNQPESLAEAKMLLEQALAADSSNLNYQYHMALLEYEAGNAGAAKARLAELLAGDNEFSEKQAAMELAAKLN